MIYISDLQYFPSIDYIITLYKQENVTFYSSLPFRKSTFRNRLVLPGANGLINLSIPIKGGRSVKTAYSNVEIDYKVDWQKSHLRSIASIYGNAPYFEYYKSDLEHLYKCREVNLFKWNLKCFDFFMSRSKLSKMMDFGVLYDNFKEGDLIRELGDDFSGSLPLPMYPQVFSDKIGFQSNVSSLDLLMNLGPESASYIQEASNKLH